MLTNIDQALYARFKKEGYRIKTYVDHPVASIPQVVQLAYLDVNRTLAGIDPEQSRSFKQAVVSFIEKLLTVTAAPPMSQAMFDQLHHQCCRECLDFSSPRTPIHYGQAQKLLNMSLKYLYNEFAVYKGKPNYFGFPDNNIEHFFHLPIDNQILKALVDKYHFNDPTNLPWSQWRYDHYIAFQSQLRKRINTQYSPLEIDYMLWNTNGSSVDMREILR